MNAETPVAGDDTPAAIPPRGWLPTMAFGATLIIWIIAYVISMPAVALSPWVLIALTAIVLLGAGVIAGRSAGVALGGGAILGVTITAINLLILSSLGRGEQFSDVVSTALPWIGGFLIGAVLLCGTGAVLGSTMRSKHAQLRRDWTGRFALVVAANTLLLVTAGGVVTGYEAGMAVPDWLTTFGYPMMLYPLELMRESPDVYYEHFHRLWGLLVGLSTLTLAIYLWLRDPRGWVRITGVVILLLVIIQGVLGGTRVTEDNLTLGIIHGVFGQIVFALLVCMAAFTSTLWRHGPDRAAVDSGKSDIALSRSLLGVVILQIALGALYRHLDADPQTSEQTLFVTVNIHMAFGILIAVKLIFVGIRAGAKRRDMPPLSALGMALMILTPLQIVLGLIAYVLVQMVNREPGDPIPATEVIFTSAHQVTGALILAASALLLAWTTRLIRM